MKYPVIFLISLFFSITAAADEEFVCAMGDLERVISVVYLSDGPLPCEVRYDKGEGAEVLWTAEHTEGYCEKSAREFIEQQEEWGYECTHTQ